MPKINLLVHINAYSDDSYSNAPTLNNIKWHRDYNGINAEEPNGQSIKMQPSQSVKVFDGTTAISADNTTTYDLSLKVNTSQTYVLQHNSGTQPVFRVTRALSISGITEFSITKTGKILNFTLGGDYMSSLISEGVIVGDEVRLGSPFNANNQGKFKILALTANSFSVENEIGIAENITLGAGEFSIYSSTGVQVGSKVEIQNGFSAASLGTYEITDVYPDKLEFFSDNSIPNETNIQALIAIYESSKKFVYVESDTKVTVIINGSKSFDIEPFILGINKKPGIFMLNSYIYSLEVTSNPSQSANVFVVSAE